MKHLHLILIATLASLVCGIARAGSTPTQYKVELENQIRDRVTKIVEKVEANSIVQVKVGLVSASADLPGTGFGAVVVPVESDGKLGSGSVTDIQIRVLTPNAQLPTWITNEIDQALKFTGVKTKIAYEKFAGEIVSPKDSSAAFLNKLDTDFIDQFLKKDAFDAFKNSAGSMKTAVWGVIAALLICGVVLSIFMMVMSSRFEKSLARVLETKLVPALAQMKGGDATPRAREKSTENQSAKPLEIQLPSAAGQRELAEFPVATLATLILDCYWTKSDGYAHWLWEQTTLAQREALMALGKIDPVYFSYVRQFAATNLKYHDDARYFQLTDDFSMIDQAELADWVRKNPEGYSRITPLRADLLPISLPERIKCTSLTGKSAKAFAGTKKSTLRELPAKLEVKTLLPEDEIFVLANPQLIPASSRGALKTLAWLALAPLEYRQSVLTEMDAREIAEALAGPEEVIAKLHEALTAKKLESVLHYAKDVPADRQSDAYESLVTAGLRAPLTAIEDKKLKVAA